MQTITLKHISKLSGFSISTISKALNDGHDISKKTKLKIRGLAKNYNYIPNSAAIALRNKKTKIIAVIVPQINSILYSGVISGIQENAFNNDYKVLILQSLGSRKRELKCINDVMDGCVDGIIIVNSSKQHEESFNKTSRINVGKLPTSQIYINTKLSINMNDSKSLGERSLDTLLRQIN